MKDVILDRLRRIEAEEGVRIVYACESGSRAWGFPSADSDYDVRFIYLHPREWYLSVNLELKRDVIERGVAGQLDISGWDLRKALQLLQKSNPPLMEWLGSPIVYLEPFTVADQMRDLVARTYSPAACLYHYWHMARKGYQGYLRSPEKAVKRCFYVLRPLLAIRWIEQGRGVVPTEFQTMVDPVLDSAELKEEIGNLLAAKRRGKEVDGKPQIERIDRFLEDEMARLEGRQFAQEYARPAGDDHALDRLFQAALAEVWG